MRKYIVVAYTPYMVGAQQVSALLAREAENDKAGAKGLQTAAQTRASTEIQLPHSPIHAITGTCYPRPWAGSVLVSCFKGILPNT